MMIKILKSKLHRALITETHIDYEGSCAIDSDLLDAADICEYEMIHIYNLNNGERFTTYAIKAEKKFRCNHTEWSCHNFKGNKNDLVIICSYIDLPKKEIKKHSPKLIYFKKNSNQIDQIKSSIPTQKNNVVSI